MSGAITHLSLKLSAGQSRGLDRVVSTRNLRSAAPRETRSSVLRSLIDRAIREETAPAVKPGFTNEGDR